MSLVGDSLNLNYGNDTVVPEPSTFVVWGIGAITVLIFRLRRRKRAA